MEHYKYIIIVLVYKNVDDLKECIDSIYKKITFSKIIVVNSYYDEQSKKAIQITAENGNCVFINVENKGYSFGNNRGIEYAREHYNYDYIIVSNPDITIKKFNDKIIDRHPEFGIIAPKIIAASGKLQNPMNVVRSRVSEYLEYQGFKRNSKLLLTVGIGIGKIQRMIAVMKHKKHNNPYIIYAAHGSFVILSRQTVETLYPVYDENVFLFAEEGILAYKAKEAKIRTGQFDTIVINHKEDGSMKLSNLSINDELKKANIYYYENYAANKKS